MASVTSMSRLEQKRRAVAYYNENNVPKQLEILLNDMFVDDPSDINGYMAEYFSSLAKPPVIAQICTRSQLSPAGNTTMMADLFCVINGVEKHVCEFKSLIEDALFEEPPSAQVAVAAKTPVAPKPKGKAKGKDAVAASPMLSTPQPPEVKRAAFNYQRYQDIISNEFIPLLKGLPLIDNQHTVDKMLSDIGTSLVEKFSEEANRQLTEITFDVAEENKSEVTEASTVASNQPSMTTESTTAIAAQKQADMTQKIEEYKLEVEAASLFLSSLVSHAAAVLNKTQLYQYLNTIFNDPASDSFELPSPAICFFSCGLESPGKCNLLKQVFLLPKLNVDLNEGIQTILKIYRETEKVLQQKYGPSGLLRNSEGVLTPTFERPEIVFEVLTQACVSLSIDLKESCDIILNAAASTLFDEDKKKYEIIQGNQRMATELVAVYEEWLKEFPIVAIIDGLSAKDTDNAALLHTQLGHACILLTDMSSTCTVTDVMTALTNKHCSGFVWHGEANSLSVTQMHEHLNNLHATGLSNAVMFGGSSLECSDSTFCVDLAVALRCTFLSIGAPSGCERMNKLNRLLHIKSELDSSALHKPRATYILSEPHVEADENETPESDR